MKLNLGCHLDHRDNWINADYDKTVKPDIICDACHLPFLDGSFRRIDCIYVLEHIRDLDSVMSEIHRVLADDGVFIIGVPYYSSKIAFSTPSHVRFFSEDTFEHYQHLFDYKVRKVRSIRQLIREFNSVYVLKVMLRKKPKR